MSSNYYQFFVRQIRKPLINKTQSQLPEDAVLPISFKRYNSSHTIWASEDDEEIDISQPPVLTAKETITKVPRAELLSDRRASTVLMSEVLSRMDVPERKQKVILKDIFQVLESTTTELPIHVGINRITFRLGYIRDRSNEMIQRVTNESMATYEARPIPASKSFIKDLERVSLDDSDNVKESCVICMECFEVGVQAIRLPCSHFFHEECSVQWLMTSHLCPLCRYPMPCEED
ncbi:uncharacterized protein LOC126801255 [Argentina anserina]|uniref:uncharacterized protein LOC126801255 n=1 Tax=Argentina anserina TaxID=57926 RepID=UPI002176310F|nr:uncharacterized protein LOC126801255 [Potentilla anserina]